MSNDIMDVKSEAVGLMLRQLCARERLTLKEVGERAHYSPSYLSKLVRGERPLTPTALERLAEVLHLSASERASLWATTGNAPPPVGMTIPTAHPTSGSHIPEYERFHGREEELETVRRWLIHDRCRVVVVHGLGGIGKTALIARLATHLRDDFSHIIWHTLTPTSSFDEMVRASLRHFAGTEYASPTSEAREPLDVLLAALRTERSLLILDDLETILRPDGPAGAIRPEHEQYQRLIETMRDRRHRSCLLVISHTLPKAIEHHTDAVGPVRELHLQGVDDEAGRYILMDKGFAEHTPGMRPLIQQYAGHPLALKLAGGIVQRFFGGDIAHFLKAGQPVTDEHRALLDQHFTHLTPHELDLLYWLAIEREPVKLETLQKDLSPLLAQGEILGLLDSLYLRSLIEVRGAGTFGLHAFILTYVTERFVSAVCREMRSESFDLLASHALLKAKAAEHVRASQRDAILAPLAEHLRDTPGEGGMKQWVSQQFEALRQATVRPSARYVAGNLLNLLVHVGGDLRGLDCSRLVIRQADLRAADLTDANFSQTDVTTSVFAEVFGGVLGLAFCPGRPLLAAGTMSYEICLWNPTDGTPVGRLTGHRGWVRKVAFSPDGRWLASASDDATMRLWDAEKGELAGIMPHPDQVRALAFSPDGKWLASGCGDGRVRLWEVARGGSICVLAGHHKPVSALAFHPRGTLLASGSHDHIIKLWRIPSGTEHATFDRHQAHVRALAFSPDGKWLASGGADQTIHLWTMGTYAHQRAIPTRTPLWALAFSPDGQLLAGAGEDRTIQLWKTAEGWEVATGQEHTTLPGHRQRVREVAFDPDSGRLASGGDDQMVRIWDPLNRAHDPLRTLTGYNASVWALAFSPDGRWLASGGEDPTIRLHELPGGQIRLRLRGQHHRLAALAFSPDGTLLATGGEGQAVRLHELPSGRHAAELPRYGAQVRALAFSPDGRWLAIAGDGPAIQLWGTHGWGEIIHLHDAEQTTSAIRALAFSRDGRWLACGGNNGALHLWDIERQEIVHTLSGHAAQVCAVAFSPRSEWLASGGADHTIRLWDVETGARVRDLEGHKDWVRSLSFSPDGRLLVSGGDDAMVRLWGLGDDPSGQLLGMHDRRVWAVAYHPYDAHLLASAGEDGTLRLWNPRRAGDAVIVPPELPYDRMSIRGIRGLTEAQYLNLKALGARD